jgi:hypothetical protein
LRIEAVTVCVDYADFLEVTLPNLRAAVDDLVVVTCPEDVRTQDLCDHAGVRVVSTDAMHRDGRQFSLGAGIDAGLKALPLSDWALVVDADIVLPRGFHRTVQYLQLDPMKLYGVDRVHCRGRAAWDRFCTEPRSIRSFEVPFLRDFPVGARIKFDEVGGYLPCGYFQLWNGQATGYRDYPVDPRGTAEGSDLAFSVRFPRQYRELIPETVAIQLETDQAGDPVGVSWAGRRTPEFSIEGGEYRR